MSDEHDDGGTRLTAVESVSVSASDQLSHDVGDNDKKLVRTHVPLTVEHGVKPALTATIVANAAVLNNMEVCDCGLKRKREIKVSA